MLLFLQIARCWLWMAKWTELPKAAGYGKETVPVLQHCPAKKASSSCWERFSASVQGPGSSIKFFAASWLYLEHLALFRPCFGSWLSKNWSSRAVRRSRGSWTSRSFAYFLWVRSVKCFAQRMEKKLCLAGRRAITLSLPYSGLNCPALSWRLV